MGLGPGLHIRQTQTLVMSQQLQQAIKLLQLSSLDLQQEIRQAVESNLMLEFDEDDGAGPSIEEQAAGRYSFLASTSPRCARTAAVSRRSSRRSSRSRSTTSRSDIVSKQTISILPL